MLDVLYRKRRCGQKLTPQKYDELHSKLTKERDNICCSSTGFSFLGPDIVCPRPVINHLCKVAQSVHTIDDIKIQCSKAKEQNFQFWKHLAVMLDTHIKCVYKVHKRNDPTLVMFSLI